MLKEKIIGTSVGLSAAACLGLLCGCESLPGDPGTQGAVAGGVTGAAIGGAAGDVPGAVIGGAAGAGGGYLIGEELGED